MSSFETCEIEICEVLKTLSHNDPITEHHGVQGMVVKMVHNKCRDIARRYGYEWTPDFGLSH